MISQAHRFHGHTALRYVYQHGHAVRGPLFSIKYALNNRRTTFRVAVVVSKKVHKSAVTRNRIRRRLYALLGQQQTAIGRPYDIVVTVFSEQVATVPPEELKHSLETLLKQAKVLAPPVGDGR